MSIHLVPTSMFDDESKIRIVITKSKTKLQVILSHRLVEKSKVEIVEAALSFGL